MKEQCLLRGTYREAVARMVCGAAERPKGAALPPQMGQRGQRGPARRAVDTTGQEG
jgi:hypothetical protein